VVMPFGKFRGLAIADLPDTYLSWLHGLPDLFGSLRREVDTEFERRWQAEACNDDPMALDLDDEDRALFAEVIRRGFHSMARLHHPDAGGSPEVMMRLNALRDHLRERGLAP
jgi:Putative quorum-sensing-regulated virulence factor